MIGFLLNKTLFHRNGIKWLLILLFCLAGFKRSFCQKKVYIPNEFKNTNSPLHQWSWSRSYQDKNFVIFWGPNVAKDPTTEPNPDQRFDPKGIADTLETSYKKYIDDIKFLSDAPSTNLGTYKIIIVMNNTWGKGGPTGWAFGGQYDGVIGAMWIAANATRDGAVLSHEFTHTLQNMNWIQNNTDGGGFINYGPAGFFWETHANFMRCQVYPELASVDMPRWLGTQMFHWSSTRHHYDAYHLLFYMQQLDGIQIINDLWHQSKPDEHPLMTYKRLKDFNQSQFNDFMYDYAKREVTDDYPVNHYGSILRKEILDLKKNNPHYLWRQYTILQKVESGSAGRYIVPKSLAPQEYGFNIIPLYPSSDDTVIVKFKGHDEADITAGWRYGFVTEKIDGTISNYSPTYSRHEAIISYKMRSNESRLFLVIMGAPTEYTPYKWEPGWPKIKRYPYELNIKNAVPEGYQDNFRKYYKDQIDGASHPNGGGFVAATAHVAPNVYVGPDAMVLGSSQIIQNARIEGNAWVENADVGGHAIISGNANIFGGSISGYAKITDFAICNNCTISDNVQVKGDALLFGSSLKGNVIVGGDAEGVTGCVSGVYLQTPNPNNGRKNCDGKGAEDPSNQDVNKTIIPFSNEVMSFDNTGGNSNNMPNTIKLLPNRPNPFTQSTLLRFKLSSPVTKATLQIFNILGRCVTTLFADKSFSAGTHSFTWIPQKMASGIYIYRLTTNKKIISKKLIYIK